MINEDDLYPDCWALWEDILNEELPFPGSSWRGCSSRKIHGLAVSLTAFLNIGFYPGNFCQSHEERSVYFEGKYKFVQQGCMAGSPNEI